MNEGQKPRIQEIVRKPLSRIGGLLSGALSDTEVTQQESQKKEEIKDEPLVEFCSSLTGSMNAGQLLELTPCGERSFALLLTRPLTNFILHPESYSEYQALIKHTNIVDYRIAPERNYLEEKYPTRWTPTSNLNITATNLTRSLLNAANSSLRQVLQELSIATRENWVSESKENIDYVDELRAEIILHLTDKNPLPLPVPYAVNWRGNNGHAAVVISPILLNHGLEMDKEMINESRRFLTLSF